MLPSSVAVGSSNWVCYLHKSAVSPSPKRAVFNGVVFKVAGFRTSKLDTYMLKYCQLTRCLPDCCLPVVFWVYNQGFSTPMSGPLEAFKAFGPWPFWYWSNHDEVVICFGFAQLLGKTSWIYIKFIQKKQDFESKTFCNTYWIFSSFALVLKFFKKGTKRRFYDFILCHWPTGHKNSG